MDSKDKKNLPKRLCNVVLMINNSKWQKTLLNKESSCFNICMSYAFKIWLWEYILFCVLSLKHHISSNNSRGRLFLFSHQKRVIIQWSRLFQILLTGSHALTILFYYPIKQKIITSNKTEHGLFKCSKFGSLINFRSLDRLWSVLLDQIPLQLDRKVIKERENGEKDVGGGD